MAAKSQTKACWVAGDSIDWRETGLAEIGNGTEALE
jgi:hypothetical protein